MSDEVTGYIQALGDWRAELCASLREMVCETVPGAQERMQYGKPHFLKDGAYVALIHGGKDRVSFVIFNAGGLDEIKGFLKATASPERKAVAFRRGDPVDLELLASLLKRAAAG